MQSLTLNANAALYPQQNSFNTYSQPYHLAQNTNPNTTSDVGNYANNQLPQPKPIYTNPNPRRYSTGEILWEGVKGFEHLVVMIGLIISMD